MVFINKSAKPLLFVLLSAAILLTSTQTQAQKRQKYSSTEDIAIAFYKTGNVIPNFEKWIKQREPYTLTPWARMEGVYKQELSRLNLAYKNFDPKEDHLLIRTFVRLNPIKETDMEGNETYRLQMTFLRAPEAMYFPYDFLGERIVVMPHKLDLHMNSAITKAEYELISETVPHSAKNTMVVRLLAKEAKTKRPYEIDGMQQWLFTADVVSLEVWSKLGRLLWEYTAPWYVSPNTKKLNNLYDSGPLLNPDAGAIKPLEYYQ